MATGALLRLLLLLGLGLMTLRLLVVVAVFLVLACLRGAASLVRRGLTLLGSLLACKEDTVGEQELPQGPQKKDRGSTYGITGRKRSKGPWAREAHTEGAHVGPLEGWIRGKGSDGKGKVPAEGGGPQEKGRGGAYLVQPGDERVHHPFIAQALDI